MKMNIVFCSVELIPDLLLWIFVLDDVNELPDLECELVHIFGLVFIGGLHPVEDARGQVVSRGACNTSQL